jgi:hypothetical protein
MLRNAVVSAIFSLTKSTMLRDHVPCKRLDEHQEYTLSNEFA